MMLLSLLFNTSASAWEEKVAAAALLDAQILKKECFEEGHAERILLILEALRGLPPAWARTLALETINEGNNSKS